MVFQAIRQGILDLWEDVFLLITFNLIWCVGTLLLIPFPFVTIGLTGVMYEISQERAVSFGDFLSYGRKFWRIAYLWGGIAAVVGVVLLVNIRFYANIEASWAVTAQVVIIALFAFWVVLQLLTVSMLVRLETPTIRLAMRNALIVLGRHLLAIPVLVGLLIGGLATWWIAILIGPVLILAVSNRIVKLSIERQLGTDE